jgi:hypothetical protein
VQLLGRRLRQLSPSTLADLHLAREHGDRAVFAEVNPRGDCHRSAATAAALAQGRPGHGRDQDSRPQHLDERAAADREVELQRIAEHLAVRHVA